MKARTHIPIASVVVGLACVWGSGSLFGAENASLSGAITGMVTDSGGVPQMGAAVMLFNRQDRLFEKAFTDDKGVFAFAGLLPDIYSIRVTLASFVPAIRDNILVQPGMRSALNVSMATLFSSIHLIYPAEQPVFMSDDWKWVLRTASSTRPVLRLLPNVSLDESKPHKVVFSDTRGLLLLSAGDGALVSGFGSSADMGTAFALGTSLFGTNQIQFAGNVGTGAQSGIPSAAFRTTYSRNMGAAASPEVSVTVRELFLPGRMGAAIFGADSGVPMLRSVSINLDDSTQLSDSLSLEYGAAFESVSFMDHLSYFRPHAKLTYSLGNDGEIEFDYTTGNARPDPAGSGGLDGQLQRDVDALGQFPMVSLRGGHAEVQRGQDFELGYSRTVGSRKFHVSTYRESVSNLALTISSPEGFLPSGDILPDFYSGTAMFDAGSFSSMGYLASVTQKIGDNINATVTYGSMGALTTEHGELVSHDPDELRSMIRVGRQSSLTTRLDGIVRHTGTHIAASYQWADNHWAVPDPLDCARNARPEPGLNIYLRQPIPGLSVLPWRMELSADLRNLLQQGYLPLSTVDGSRLVLMETPRMFRGGLSFIF